MKRSASFIIAALIVVLLVGAALPESADAKVLKGSGTLRARGSGLAILDCKEADIDITGHGVGVIVIKGAEVIEAQGRGRRVDLPNGVVHLVGWRGKVSVSGTDLRVLIEGVHIEFQVTGTGRVFLKGRGRYWVNERDGTWNEAGSDIDME